VSQAPQTQEKGVFQNADAAMNIFYWFCSMWAASVEVMLRHSFGQRYLGLQAAAVLLWIPLFISLWGHPSALPLLSYLLLYVVILVVHRVQGAVRWHRGVREHSYYSGRPHISKLVGRLDELPIKTFIEPGIVLAAGSLLCGLAEGMGAYFLGAAFCLAAKGAIERAQEDKIVMDTRDAFFMQRRLRERMGRF
jgi:hypothetical protein